MARPLRLEYPGALWHVTSRGNEGRAIFLDEADRLRFVSQLARAVERFGWILHAWALMTNHYHLVIETPQCTLSRGMHWLNGLYAQSFNRRHDRIGHLFQGRPKMILVDSKEYFLEVVRYTVLNPVRAKMVGAAEEYRWSSYRATAGLEPRPAWLTTEAILGRLADDPVEAQRLYRSFVTDGLHVPSPWEKLSGQIYLGGHDFRVFVQSMIDEKERSDEHPRAMREPGCPSLGELGEAVAERFDVAADALLSGRGGEARLALVHLGWHRGRLRLGQLANGIGVRSRGYVSTLVRRGEHLRERDPVFRARLDSCCEQFRPPPARSVMLEH